jgi:peroxiredoxin
MKKKINWWVIIGVSVVGICLVSCLGVGLLVSFAPDIYERMIENSSLNVGSTAPDFELTSLTGETVRLSQFNGQPVLLSIGATWCPDCRLEAPVLEETHQTYPELVVLLVDSKESADVVQVFADEFGITHPILLDLDGKVSEQYQIFAIPTVLFIDADGIIRAKVIEGATPQSLAKYLPLIGVDP